MLSGISRGVIGQWDEELKIIRKRVEDFLYCWTIFYIDRITMSFINLLLSLMEALGIVFTDSSRRAFVRNH